MALRACAVAKVHTCCASYRRSAIGTLAMHLKLQLCCPLKWRIELGRAISKLSGSTGEYCKSSVCCTTHFENKTARCFMWLKGQSSKRRHLRHVKMHRIQNHFLKAMIIIARNQHRQWLPQRYLLLKYCCPKSESDLNSPSWATGTASSN